QGTPSSRRERALAIARNLDLRSDVGHLRLPPAGARRKSRANFWVSAYTYPPVVDGCLQGWGFYYRDWFGWNHIQAHARHQRSEPLHRTRPGNYRVANRNLTRHDRGDAAATVEEMPALAVKSVKELHKRSSVGQQ